MPDTDSEPNVYVTSDVSSEAGTRDRFEAPQRFRGHGVLSPLDDASGSSTLVPVPFREEALRAWAEDSEVSLVDVQQNMAMCVERLEVCAPLRRRAGLARRGHLCWNLLHFLFA